MRNLIKLSGLLIAAVFLFAACDDGGEEDADVDVDVTVEATPADGTPTADGTATETPATDTTPTETVTATPTTAAGGGTGTEDGETIEVTGIDYGFEGIPETVEQGTQFTFTNASDVEFHEMILFHIPESEGRPIAELLALPEEEAAEIVGAPIGVAVAMPGEDGEVVEGELVANEPGRYAVFCFIPTGADPQEFAEAMQNPGEGEPPQVEGGPPHVAQGMYAEFTVE